MSADFSELMSLAKDLDAAPKKAIPNIRKAVEFTARGVKDSWQAESKSRTLRGYPSAVDYDMLLDTDGSIGAEIGPNLGKLQGSFGLVEGGGGGVLSAPRHNDRKALKANEADFYDGLAKAIGDAL